MLKFLVMSPEVETKELCFSILKKSLSSQLALSIVQNILSFTNKTKIRKSKTCKFSLRFSYVKTLFHRVSIMSEVVNTQIVVVESENESIEIVEEVKHKPTKAEVTKEETELIEIVDEENGKSTVGEVKDQKTEVAKDTNENVLDENLKNLESVVDEMLKDERSRASIQTDLRKRLKKKQKGPKGQNSVNQALLRLASKLY